MTLQTMWHLLKSRYECLCCKSGEIFEPTDSGIEANSHDGVFAGTTFLYRDVLDSFTPALISFV